MRAPLPEDAGRPPVDASSPPLITVRRHGRVTTARIVGGLVSLATAWVVLRLPGGVFAALLLPALALILAGLRRPRGDSWLLWLFLVAAVASSTVGVLLAPPPVPLVNFSTITLTFTVFISALLATGLERRLTRTVMLTLYWCFGATALIGVGEIITGFRLITVLYPESSTVAIENRFLVAAFFPNYNDFAVVVTMFAIMTLARLLMANRSRLAAAFHLAAFLISAVIIIGQGSRGALLALLMGSALLLLQTVRLMHPQFLSPLSVILGTLALILLALLAWTSPWLQDHSTASRGSILTNTLAMSPDNSRQFWLGWGDIGSFQDAAAQAYPWTLMDPHNILLEAFTWYGLPSLVLLVVLWLHVSWRGLWLMEIRPGWHSMAALVLFSLTPVLGIVPSSSLRYYYMFLLAACAVAALTPRETRR